MPKRYDYIDEEDLSDLQKESLKFMREYWRPPSLSESFKRNPGLVLLIALSVIIMALSILGIVVTNSRANIQTKKNRAAIFCVIEQGADSRNRQEALFQSIAKTYNFTLPGDNEIVPIDPRIIEACRPFLRGINSVPIPSFVPITPPPATSSTTPAPPSSAASTSRTTASQGKSTITTERRSSTTVSSSTSTTTRATTTTTVPPPTTTTTKSSVSTTSTTCVTADGLHICR